MAHTKHDEQDAASLCSTEPSRDAAREDPLADASGLIAPEVPAGVDRRHFLIRSAVGGAAAVMTGHVLSAGERTAMAVATLPPQAKPKASPAPPLSKDLNVVK